MAFPKDLNLLILAAGLMLFSVSLHLKKEPGNLKFGLIDGWAKNLTGKGKLLFFVGFILSIIGALL